MVTIKNRHSFIAYLLIGLGVYFLIKQLDLAIFRPFFGWPTILFIIGVSFLLHSYTAQEKDHLFLGILLVGFGVHFHGILNYSFWYDHWSIYALIVGLAYLFLFLKTKKGLIPAIVLLSIASIMIFSITLPTWFEPVYAIIDFIETFWPVLLIALGIYFIKKK